MRVFFLFSSLNFSLWKIVNIFNNTQVCAKLLQLYQALCDPIDCSLPGSSVHEISQARIQKWAAISSSRGSSSNQARISCIAGRFFTTEPPGKPHSLAHRRYSQLSPMYPPPSSNNSLSLQLIRFPLYTTLCPSCTILKQLPNSTNFICKYSGA